MVVVIFKTGTDIRESRELLEAENIGVAAYDIGGIERDQS
jgi:hypothetical protein